MRARRYRPAREWIQALDYSRPRGRLQASQGLRQMAFQQEQLRRQSKVPTQAQGHSRPRVRLRAPSSLPPMASQQEQVRRQSKVPIRERAQPLPKAPLRVLECSLPKAPLPARGRLRAKVPLQERSLPPARGFAQAPIREAPRQPPAARRRCRHRAWRTRREHRRPRLSNHRPYQTDLRRWARLPALDPTVLVPRCPSESCLQSQSLLRRQIPSRFAPAPPTMEQPPSRSSRLPRRKTHTQCGQSWLPCPLRAQPFLGLALLSFLG